MTRIQQCLMLLPFVMAPAGYGQAENVPQVFGGAKVEEVYRVRLDRGDLLLESINRIVKENHIEDGAVLSAVGSLDQCTYHRVKTTAAVAEDETVTVKGPIEILSANGIIAAGEPHIHMALSMATGAFGGHLEPGCRVLYRGELTIVKFSGVPLARLPNKEGTPLLQKKK